MNLIYSNNLIEFTKLEFHILLRNCRRKKRLIRNTLLLQQLFRSQPQGATPQQLQLLQQQQQQQQQQYLAASQAQQQQQQQQQQNFPTAPYTVISGQEPYVGALIAGAPPPVVPQYYGVAPWVYPAGLLPQAPPQAAAPPPPRRPLTPSSAAAAAAVAQDTANNLAQSVSKLISPLALGTGAA